MNKRKLFKKRKPHALRSFIMAAMCCFALISASEVKAQTIGTVLYVDQSIQTSGDGTSWAKAYRELADAVKDANTTKLDVTHILVAQGTYLPKYHPYYGKLYEENKTSDAYFAEWLGASASGGVTGTGNVDKVVNTALPTFYFSRDIIMLGGYPNKLSDWSTTAATNADYYINTYKRNPKQYTTILKGKEAVTVPYTRTGNGAGTGTYTTGSFHVVLTYNLTQASLFDGFTITGGNNSAFDLTAPFKLYIDGVLSSSANKGLRRVANTAGAGMYNHNSSPRIENVIITNNIAVGPGGGMYNTNNSSPTLTNVTISKNSAGSAGVGMGNGSGQDTPHFGGGICNYRGSSVTLNNVTLIENTSNTASAIHIVTKDESRFDELKSQDPVDSSGAILNNVTIKNNKNGDAISVGATGTLTMTDVGIIGNTGGAGIGNSGGTVTFTRGTITGNGDRGIKNTNDSYKNLAGTTTDSPGTITLKYVEITKNTFSIDNDSGAGVYNSGTLTMADVSITGNEAKVSKAAAITIKGVGIHNTSTGILTMIRGSITGNIAEVTSTTANAYIYGVGIYNNYGNITLTNVSITKNVGTATSTVEKPISTRGVGIYNSANTPNQVNLINVAITDNEGVINSPIKTSNQLNWNIGVGFYQQTGAATTTILTNVTIAGNVGTNDIANTSHTNFRALGGGIYIYGGGVSVNNSIIARNTMDNVANNVYGHTSATSPAPTYQFTLLEDGPTSTGIISTEDPEFNDPLNSDYTLINCSKAKNVGNNDLFPTTITMDLAGKTRIQETIIDLGAYESQGRCILPQTEFWWKGNGEGTTDIDKNLWTINSNWVGGDAPLEEEEVHVKYHKEAIDLYVNGTYNKVKSIKPVESKNAGLAILPGASLTVASWDSDDNITTKGGQITVKANTTDDKTIPNGAFVVPNRTTVKAHVEFKHLSPSENSVNTINTMTWQYFGIPVQEDYDPGNLYGFYVRRYKESLWDGGNKWWKMLTNNDYLVYNAGYEIGVKKANDRLHTFSGTLLTDDVTISGLTKTATTNDNFEGQHVITNPFTAAINIKDITGINLDGGVYLFHTGTHGQWETAIGSKGTGAGQYVTVPQEQAGVGGLPATIASMQGFVMRVTATGGSVTLPYPAVATNPAMRSPALHPEKVYTSILLSSGDMLKDRVWLFTDENATHGYDIGYDGYKLFGASALSQLYIKELDGSNYQVNTAPSIDGTAIWFKAEEGVSDYTLNFNHENIDGVYENIYLLDLQTGMQTDITADGSTYHFRATNETVAEKRFVINKQSEEGGGPTGLLVLTQWDSDVFIQNNYPTDGTITLYDLRGQKIMTRPFPAFSRTTIFQSEFPQGMYILSVEVENEKLNKKVFIR